jgi:hypothetical protein
VENRHFLNVVGFGFDIAVIEDSWRVRYLRGAPLYLYCAVRQLYRFPGSRWRWRWTASPGAAKT